MSYSKDARKRFSPGAQYDRSLKTQTDADAQWYLSHGFPPDYARQFALDNTHGASVKPRPLTTDERESLNVILQRYDASMNVRKEDLPESTQEDVDELERTGAIRIVNGRIIPNFILEEHGAPDRGRYEGITG